MVNIGFHFGGQNNQILGQRLSGSFELLDSRQKSWPLLSSLPAQTNSQSRQLKVLNVPLRQDLSNNADGLSAGAWTMIGVAAVGVVSAVVLSSKIDDKIERCNNDAARSDPSCFDQTPADESDTD